MQILLKYFPDLSPSQISQFEKMGMLYREWNEKINVVSRKDIDALYEKHILHSLGIAKVCSFKDGTEILDVGTGGGFPGIPLAVMFPECQFTLVDSIGKKIKVVEEVANGLELKNVKALNARAEQVDIKVDFVVSRAVTRFAPFYEWIKNKFLKGGFNDLDNGVLYLKGGDLEEEMKEYGKKYRLFELSNYFSEEFFETKKVVYVPVKG
ncbi:MAG TPA: 16S rRNA (guanine(527)-N(7))-methyltransferase RsmG [Cytophagaceae bacterium]|nr:16S rRNA (guanine(527)-N(7))-methyltransferase RsmG [Cytophagaceae bacterium]